MKKSDFRPQVARDLPNPANWGNDLLSEFVEATRQNTLATFTNLREEFDRLSAVDKLFFELGTNLDNPQDIHVPFFLYLAHGAYRAAARLAMSGQLPPAYMVLRGCLEYALYGHFVHRTEGSFEVWRSRGENEAGRKAAKKMFTYGAVLRCLKREDAKLGEVASRLYDRTIEFGAHPNEKSLFTSLGLEETAEKYAFEVAYLHGAGVPLKLGLKSTAQVGACAFGVFRSVFPSRCDLLGLSDELAGLQGGL